MSSVLKDTDHLPALIGRLLAPESGVHAVLFYGAEENTLSRAAEELARGWLCLTPKDAAPCGECRACAAFSRGNHVDFKLIQPKGASAIIKIGAITARQADPGEEAEQSLQEFFRTSPLFGQRKVGFISSAHRMNEAASNSLLKMLEEPHLYAKIILTTTALGDLLPTILSRCVNVPVRSSGIAEASAKSAKEIERLACAIGCADPSRMLEFSEGLRGASEQIQSEEGVGARNAHSLALVAFAEAVLRNHRDHPEWAQRAIEAHRRVVGNASASLVFDSLCASILTGKG
jgi:DNA polymerase-3 subunit delta'